MKVEVRERRLRFARPVRTAFGTLEEREVVELTLTAADRVSGTGEAAPLEPYDGVSLDEVRGALAAYGPVLERLADAEPAAGVAWCRELVNLPQALAAVDLALWDMAGRRAGRPVAHLLSPAAAAVVPVNATIPALEPHEAAEAAASAVRDGFRTLKVKVGAGDDLARVAAVREAAGPHVALRLDANGAWSVDEAVAAIGELSAFDLELVEEPVHGVDALRTVRGRVEVAVAMDETAVHAGAAGSGATQAVCLKIASCGGITALLDQAGQARAAGSEVYVASTFDGPVGIAAGLHAAAALAPRLACGLATLDGFADPAPPGLAVVDGLIKVPTAAGLSVAPMG